MPHFPVFLSRMTPLALGRVGKRVLLTAALHPGHRSEVYLV